VRSASLRSVSAAGATATIVTTDSSEVTTTIENKSERRFMGDLQRVTPL
jgi:hypothetical protein